MTTLLQCSKYNKKLKVVDEVNVPKKHAELGFAYLLQVRRGLPLQIGGVHLCSGGQSLAKYCQQY